MVMSSQRNPLIAGTYYSKLGTTNETFLRVLFGDQNWERAHVCSFAEDPATLHDRGLAWQWAGGPAKALLPTFNPLHNAYYVISLFKPDTDGKARRRKVLHESTHAILIDDISLDPAGSGKVDVSKLVLPPSFLVETSPGNAQGVYVLKDGGDDRDGKVVALQNALVDLGLCQDFSDPGMKGVTRYARLPEGTNTKSAYTAGGTLPGFRHRFLCVSGESIWQCRRYTLEEIADAYGVLDEVLNAPDHAGSMTFSGTATINQGDDPILDALARAGLIIAKRSANVWDIECPFIDHHTMRINSGTAYLGNGGFACHHGHCQTKSSEDFLVALKAGREEIFDLCKREKAVRDFAPAGTSEVAIEMRALKNRQAALERAAKLISANPDVDAKVVAGQTGLDAQDPAVAGLAQGKRLIDRLRGRTFSGASIGTTAVLNGQWLLKGLFPVSGHAVLYGAPKTGKSFVALDLSARVAAGVDWYGHKVKRDGIVVYVSAEGGEAAARNRIAAWNKEIGTGLGVSLDRLLVYPGRLRLGAEAVEDAETMVEWCREIEAREGKGVVLIVLDTLNKNMVGDENSTADMTGYVGGVDRMWRDLGCVVLTVHHSGKDASKGARGSGVLLADVEAELEITREKDLGLNEPGRVYLGNARHAQDNIAYGFQLEKVVLGIDSDLDEVTSCVVRECKPPVGTSASGAGASSARLGSRGKLILKTFDDLLVKQNGDPFADQDDQDMVPDATIDEDVLLDEVMERARPLYKNARKRNFKQTLDQMLEDNVYLERDPSSANRVQRIGSGSDTDCA